MNLGNILNTRSGTHGQGNVASPGISVVNNPGYSIAPTNPYGFSENLGNVSSDKRKAYYQAGDFSALPGILSANPGLTLGAVTADYNSMMGTNVNPVDAAMEIYGFTPQQIGAVLTSGNAQLIAQTASALGIDATSLTNWYNNYSGSTIKPDQTTAYLTQGPTTTTNLMESITGAKGPSSQSSSGGGGSSFSGMDWSKSPVSFGQLQTLAADLPDLAKRARSETYNRYAKLMRDTLGDKGTYANVLNQMGNRNLMGSSVMNDSLNNVALDVAKDIGDKAYTSDIAATNMEMGIPSTLAGIANLGQVSTSNNSNWSQSVTDPGNLQNLQLLVEMLTGNSMQ
jgi:hypothetical protein